MTPQKEQIIEVHPEPEKICHNLSGLLTVVDQQLEDAQFLIHEDRLPVTRVER